VAAGGGERHVGGGADRVDGAVAGGDPGERRLPLADRHLVAPVGPLEVSPLGVGEADLAADVTDVGVGEGLDQVAQRVGRPEAVGVREGEELARGPLGGGVLGGDLAAPGQVEHEVGAGGTGPFDRRVAGAVGGDDHLEQIARIVERERVGDLRRDHLLLVVGGNDQGDAGQSVQGGRRHPGRGSEAGSICCSFRPSGSRGDAGLLLRIKFRPRALLPLARTHMTGSHARSLPRPPRAGVAFGACQDRQDEGVAQVGVGDQGEAEPEVDFDGDHPRGPPSSR
jgi:hypothetical protein